MDLGERVMQPSGLDVCRNYALAVSVMQFNQSVHLGRYMFRGTILVIGAVGAPRVIWSGLIGAFLEFRFKRFIELVKYYDHLLVTQESRVELLNIPCAQDPLPANKREKPF